MHKLPSCNLHAQTYVSYLPLDPDLFCYMHIWHWIHAQAHFSLDSQGQMLVVLLAAEAWLREWSMITSALLLQLSILMLKTLGHSSAAFFPLAFLMQYIPAHRYSYTLTNTCWQSHKYLHKQNSAEPNTCTQTHTKHPICVEGLVTFLISLCVATASYSPLVWHIRKPQ